MKDELVLNSNTRYRSWSIHTGHFEIFKMLIESEADINHRGAYDRTPLISIARASKQMIFLMCVCVCVFSPTK